MTCKQSLFSALVLVFIVAMMVPSGLHASGSGFANDRNKSDSGTARPASSVLQGTWSGAFFSKHSTSSFTLTVVIAPDSRGHLVGDSTLSSSCLKGTKLQVTATDSNVVLAGSDEEGDSLTIHGTLDRTGSLMRTTYVLNGSASGRCETDNGNGDLAKR